ncbi:hypothetical protein [Bacillus mobilis]|uniref:hypothetical protein n=1 Tax=Bacillus mobilis TaxID=2026190 RepID=UPI003698BD18
MSYIWNGLNNTEQFSDYRGSLFSVKKDFSISELLLGTPSPVGWETGEIWGLDSSNKFALQIYKGDALPRVNECYVQLSSPVKLTGNKSYAIVFKAKGLYPCYAVGSPVTPVESEMFTAISGSDGHSNFGSRTAPAVGQSAIGNSYKIQVGFTIAKSEKYFEMGSTGDTIWSHGKYTVANTIIMKQDVVVIAMEFRTPLGATNGVPSEPLEPGIARIWGDDNRLIAKGRPSLTPVLGQWTRSQFDSPVTLKKDKTYYVGISGVGIGCKNSLGARGIRSNDGSLLMSMSDTNYSVIGESDIRPNTNTTYEFSIRLYAEVNNTRFLIDSDGTIKKLSSSWLDVGSTPVTEQMFKEHGMSSLNDITVEQWRALPKNSKILVYSEEDKVFKASISRSNLYNSEEKLYRGTGIIETEMEELPAYRKTLMITADHQDCTFQYSLDNAVTWNAFQPGDIIDISKKSGKQLKIQINLPTDLATLTAISYAWA